NARIRTRGEGMAAARTCQARRAASTTRLPGAHWQGLQTPQDDIVLERRLIHQQAQVGKALQDGLKGNAPFQPGQPRPQAVVDAATEGDMAGFLAGDIELLRVAKHLRIVIGRADQCKNALALVDVATADLRVLRSEAAIDLHWTVIAYQLFDRSRHE